MQGGDFCSGNIGGLACRRMVNPWRVGGLGMGRALDLPEGKQIYILIQFRSVINIGKQFHKTVSLTIGDSYFLSFSSSYISEFSHISWNFSSLILTVRLSNLC